MLDGYLDKISRPDARFALTGFIKLYLPECRDWSTCPACYFDPNIKVQRDEAILGAVAIATAALAANVIVQLISGIAMKSLFEKNFYIVDFSNYKIESLAVQKSNYCRVCAEPSRARSIANVDKFLIRP